MVSELLAYLSLAGFLALLGQSAWKTWVMSDQTWGLHDHGLDKAREVVEWALRHCLDRGMMVVSARGTEHQVLLRKYIRLFGDRGLVFGFPDAQWSRQYIPRLCSELDARSIRFRKANEPYGQVNVVLHVDCGQDLDGVADLVRYCFLDFSSLIRVSALNPFRRSTRASGRTCTIRITKTQPARSGGRPSGGE